MGLDFVTTVEYVACAIVAATAFGLALLATEAFREIVPAVTEQDREELAIW